MAQPASQPRLRCCRNVVLGSVDQLASFFETTREEERGCEGSEGGSRCRLVTVEMKCNDMRV